MALYVYQALLQTGKRIKGQIDASSSQHAKELLLKKGMYVISISVALDVAAGIPWYKRLFEQRIKIKDKILFTKQLAVLLKSGVPLLQSLELLIEQFEGGMRTILINLKDGIKEGRSLAEGLKRYPKVFDNIYVQLVRAGEATGNLEIILDRLTAYLERRQEIQKKIKAALSYPMFQIAVVVAVVIFLLKVVVPRLAQTFAQRGAELPGPTKFMLALSQFLQNYFILLIILFLLTVAGFMYARTQKWGQKALDVVKLKFPIINYFTRISAVVQFSRTLGMLLESGVNLSEALDIVVNIISNRVLADALSQARDKIIKEGKIAQYLSETNIFPPIAIYLIKTGEQSGELGQMLLTVAQNYEAELSERTDSLSAKIEPMMMLVMAVVVGFIVIAMALPIVQMTGVVTGV